MQKSVRTLILIAASLLATHENMAHAQFPGIEWKVGLSKEVVDLIQKLPANIRIEVIKLIVEARPIIDEAIFSYIKAIVDGFSIAIEDTECSAAAIIRNTKYELNLRKDSSDIIRDYVIQVEDLQSSFDEKTHPQKYRQDYAGVAHSGYLVSCAVRRTPEALEIAREYRTPVRMNAVIWRRAGNVQCQNARDCVPKVQEYIIDVAAKAHPLDQSIVNAIARAKAVTLPVKEGFFPKFNPEPYEIRLKTLFLIEDELNVAKKNRQALDLIKPFQSQVAEMDALLSEIEKTNHLTYKSVDADLNRLKGKEIKKIALEKIEAEAVELNHNLSKTIRKIKDEIDEINKKLAALVVELLARRNYIRLIEEEEARRLFPPVTFFYEENYRISRG